MELARCQNDKDVGGLNTPTAKQQPSNETIPLCNAGKVYRRENLSAVSGAPQLYWCVVPDGFFSLFLSVCVFVLFSLVFFLLLPPSLRARNIYCS